MKSFCKNTLIMGNFLSSIKYQLIYQMRAISQCFKFNLSVISVINQGTESQKPVELWNLIRQQVLNYLGLWFDGDEDVGKQRLGPQRAVESDDSSQEGPEHHYNVDISVKTQIKHYSLQIGLDESVRDAIYEVELMEYYLFKSTVDISRASSRKQKTGYCRPSSLNRSSFILRLIFWRQAPMSPIVVALGARSRVAYCILL